MSGKALSDGLSFFTRSGETIDWSGVPAYAFLAYWVAAVRWRQQKISEAPLMVVKEDTKSGDHEWIQKHPLAPLLEQPNNDLDMGQMVARTSAMLDNTGACLWVVDSDRARRPKRMIPFAGDQFEVKPFGDRVYGQFIVKQDNRPDLTVPAVPGGEGRFGIYFRDYAIEEGWDPGKSRLDVAMDWLQLADDVRKVVRTLVRKAPKRMLLVQPDANWNPAEKQFEEWKQSLAQSANAEHLLALLGGGSATILSAPLNEVIPGELLNRVESVVASVSGVPAIVLQMEVGLQNSPWSQMEEARKMAYADTVQPAWRGIERPLTRQLLRVVDQDPTHFIAFDTSKIAALKKDRAAGVLMAMQLGDDASLNERRALAELEPLPEPEADLVPALEKLADPTFGLPPALANADPDADPDEDADNDAVKRAVDGKARKVTARQFHTLYRDVGEQEWLGVATRRLHSDRFAIEQIVTRILTDETAAALTKSAASGKADSPKRKIIAAVQEYIDGPSSTAWQKDATAMASVQARRSGRLIASEVGFEFALVNRQMVTYAAKEAGFLTDSVGKTTADAVRSVLEGGFEDGQGAQVIARIIADAVGLESDRALLIARTESGRIANAAPLEALTARAKQTGQTFTKTWRTADDARVRDEHAALEGETVGLHDRFSNGLDAPSEPNCRCILEYTEQ